MKDPTDYTDMDVLISRVEDLINFYEEIVLKAIEKDEELKVNFQLINEQTGGSEILIGKMQDTLSYMEEQIEYWQDKFLEIEDGEIHEDLQFV